MPTNSFINHPGPECERWQFIEIPIPSIAPHSLTGFKQFIWDFSLNQFISGVGILRRNGKCAARGHFCHLESIRAGAEVANARRGVHCNPLPQQPSLDTTTTATPSDQLNPLLVKKCFGAAVNHHQSSALKRSPS